MAANFSGFAKEVHSALRSKLHSRFIPYNVYAFEDEYIGVNAHVTGPSMTIVVPFIIHRVSDNKVKLLYRDKSVEGSIGSVMSFLSAAVRKEEVKLTKVRTVT